MKELTVSWPYPSAASSCSSSARFSDASTYSSFSLYSFGVTACAPGRVAYLRSSFSSSSRPSATDFSRCCCLIHCRIRA
eukprot:3517200-Rhodomonas_salina.1